MIRLLPSHTTVRTGPYTAVRNVEVQTSAQALVLIPARPASPLHFTLGASPLLSSASSAYADIWCMAFPQFTVVSLSSPFGPSRSGRSTLPEALRYYGLC